MLVMDCNATISIVLGTQDGRALEQLILEGEPILAPDLLVSECANALYKYVQAGYLTQEVMQDYLFASLGFADEYVPSIDLCGEALSESVRLDHSAYDLFYLVLARRNGATLMTLDKKLQQLCRENGVNCIFTDEDF